MKDIIWCFLYSIPLWLEINIPYFLIVYCIYNFKKRDFPLNDYGYFSIALYFVIVILLFIISKGNVIQFIQSH